MLQRGAPKLGKDGKPVKDKNGKVIYEPYRIKVLNTINFKKSIVQPLKDRGSGRAAEQPAEYRFPYGVPFGKPSPEKGVFLPHELAEPNAN